MVVECLGDDVIEFCNVIKLFGDCVLYEDFSYIIFKGVIVGIIGFNGVGKIILFCMIVGEEKLEWGEVYIGSIVDLVYVD